MAFFFLKIRFPKTQLLAFALLILLTGCKSTKPCIEPVYGSGIQSNLIIPQDSSTAPPTSEVKNPPITHPLIIAPPEPPQKAPEILLAEDTIAKMESVRPKLNRLTATSSMDIDSPELEQSVTALSRYDAIKGLYTSYRATALNFEGARSLVTRDSFFVYNRIEKELTYGSISFANRFLPVSGTIEQIMAILTGTIVPESGFNWEAFQNGEEILVRTTDFRQQYTVDAKSYRIRKAEIRNAKNELTEKIVYSEPTTFGNIVIPRRVEMTQPLAKRTVKIYHRNFEFNPEPMNFDLNVDRKKAKLVLIR